MESLTKENFWNDLQGKYPEQMKQFCAWVDEYKKRVDWNAVFNYEQSHNDLYKKYNIPPRRDAPKFHDLPIAMQWGIFYQFTVENNLDLFYQDTAVPTTMDDIRECIQGYFGLMLSNAESNKKRYNAENSDNGDL